MTSEPKATPQRPAPSVADREPLFSGGFATFCVLAAFFMASQFLRVSNAVVAKELIRDLNLSAAEFGMLGSGFFYAFAVMQIPLGWALDRFETRKILLILPFSSVVGLAVFSLADGFALAFLGRLLCGIGMSVVMMGTFKIFSLRYAPYHFATLSGIMVSVGTVGNMLAATPLVLLTDLVGWRRGFLIIGAGIAILSIGSYRLLRQSNQDAPFSSETDAPQPLSFRKGFHTLVHTPTFWQ
ncbi:MFS transporter, partial [candidate division KSB3 bacterium]|nr:MFS transporter [candidate division KSB3 bacterium]MBD3327150.1 MFS transporter [candidate division KSB3 bacterium]